MIQDRCSAAPKLRPMVGIAVATMVWSSAPRNIASMIPNTMRRISACDSGLCPAQWLWAWGARLGFLGDAVLAEFIRRILGQLVSSPYIARCGGDYKEAGGK